MNYMNRQMEEALPKTDSRFRGDIRMFEEGMIDEADEEKVKIEEK